MEQDKLWATFQKTGRVQDYLKYCGIDGFEAVPAEDTGNTQEGAHETDNRCADHTGK